MKKSLTLLLALVMAFGLGGCGKKAEKTPADVAGRYFLVSVTKDGTTYSLEEVAEMVGAESVEMYVDLSNDGTGFMFSSQDGDTFGYDVCWGNGEMWRPDEPTNVIPYTINGNTLTITFDGAQETFVKNSSTKEPAANNSDTPVVTPANPKELSEEVLKGTWSAQLPFEMLASIYVEAPVLEMCLDTIPDGMECLLVFDGENCSLLMDHERSEELVREIIETVYTEEIMTTAWWYIGIRQDDIYDFYEYYGVHSIKELVEIGKQQALDELNDEEWDGEMWGKYDVMPFDSWRIADNKLYIPSENEDYGAFFEYDGETLTIPGEDIFVDLDYSKNMTFTKISDKTDY